MGREEDFARLRFSRLVEIYRVFGRHYRAHAGVLGLALLGMLLSIATGLLAPWPIAWIVDYILEAKALPPAFAFLETWADGNRVALLAPAALSVVAIAALHAMAAFVHRYYEACASHRIVTDVRGRVFEHLQRLSLSFQQSWQSGDVVLRMTNDIKDLKKILVDVPMRYLQWSLWIIGITTVLAVNDWKLAAMAWCVVPVLYLFTLRFGSGVKAASAKKKRKESEVAAVVSENVKAMALVQAYGQEAAEKTRFDDQNIASVEAETEAIRLSKVFKRLAEILIAIGTAAVVYVGALSVLQGVLTIGLLVVFERYLKKLYRPIDKFANTFVELAGAQVSGERIVALVAEDLVVDDAGDASPTPALSGRVELRDVRFAYRQGADVLRDLSFSVEPGQNVALVGASGAGKSTLISLLLRFYDPDEGQILFDGRDIREFGLRSLREQITIVFQDPMLLRKTVRENIAFGRPDATEEEIVRAASLAEAHSFIEALPDGYDTMVMERGTNLSGGQQQRISIARAILRDTPIVILDEPSTGLDARAEAQVSEALAHLTQERTTFTIAHRFSTLRNADRVLVLEAGEPAAWGTHEELILENETYRRLYRLQFGSEEAGPDGSGGLAPAEA